MTLDNKKRWWVSDFALPDGGRSLSEVWATEEEARSISDQRGFGPPRRKTGRMKEFRPSVLARLKGGLARPDVFHSICYVGFLAARSGVVAAEELVRDGSALHELSHYLQCGGKIKGGTQEEHTMAAIRHLEEITPGVPPLDVELDLPA